MDRAVRTVGLGLSGITASLLIKTAVWFHFLDTTEDPRVLTIFEYEDATFRLTDYAAAIGLDQLFSASDPHTWLLGASCLVIIALVGWVIARLVFLHGPDPVPTGIPTHSW